MDEPQSNQASDAAFEDSRKEAARARRILNFLVILSAAASSVFLVYVITRIMPHGQGDGSNVEIPTSAAAEKIGFLRGEHREGKSDLVIELRDIDEAAGYRDQYSETLSAAMGIADSGRLYQLCVINRSKTESFEFTGGKLVLRPKAGPEIAAQWLQGLAQPQKATALGKMAIAQSLHTFTLAPGQRRTLYVFAIGAKLPAAEELAGGLIETGATNKLKLEHTEFTMGR